MLKKTSEKLPERGHEMASESTLASSSSKRWMIAGQTGLMVLVLAVGFITMKWLVDNKVEPPKRPVFKSVYTVNAVTAEANDFQPGMVVYGEIQSSRNVELRSLVGGEIIKVTEELRPGAWIKEGTTLFELDPFPYEVALSEAKASVSETQAKIAENKARISIETSRIKSLEDQLELARKDMERIEKLRTRGTATPKQVEDRSLIVSQRQQSLEQSELNLVAENARLTQQEAILERFRWRMMQAERNLEDTKLTAPFSGVVSLENAEIGRNINANDVVVGMYDATNLDVRFTLTDQRFGRIQADEQGVIGRKVDVIWIVGGEEYKFAAEIDRIGAQITSARGGVEVFASITDDVTSSPLRPGAFVEVIVPDRTFKQHFSIPESAVYDSNTIYVIKEGKLVSRAVTISAYDGDMVILKGDLVQGDQVLITRISEISDGLRVRIEGQDVKGKAE